MINRSRTNNGTMSKSLFFLLIGIFTAIGIFVSFLVSRYFLHTELSWVTAIIILIVGIAGVVLNKISDRPILSFTGYMMIAVPYGALLGPIINSVGNELTQKFLGIPFSTDISVAFFATTIYVLVFGIVGAVIPDNLDSWLRPLTGCLLVGIVGYFIIPIAGFFGINVGHALNIWDWAIVALFAIIIIVDFNRAVRMAYTLDNAIDVALDVYLDWFNVFIRITTRNND
jgi:FtsH-binding integral membrane protein